MVSLVSHTVIHMKPRRILPTSFFPVTTYTILDAESSSTSICSIMSKNETRKSLHTSTYSGAITKARKLWVAWSENIYQYETRINNEALWTGRRLLDRLKEIEISPSPTTTHMTYLLASGTSFSDVTGSPVVPHLNPLYQNDGHFDVKHTQEQYCLE